MIILASEHLDDRGQVHTRRCDRTCYEAKGARCTCICGGVNHGVGENVARLAAPEVAKEIRLDGRYQTLQLRLTY